MIAVKHPNRTYEFLLTLLNISRVTNPIASVIHLRKPATSRCLVLYTIYLTYSHNDVGSGDCVGHSIDSLLSIHRFGNICLMYWRTLIWQSHGAP